MALDLLLVNPHSSNANPMIPLGLASLAAVDQEAGCSVQVVDAWAEGLRDPELLRARLQNRPVACPGSNANDNWGPFGE